MRPVLSRVPTVVLLFSLGCSNGPPATNRQQATGVAATTPAATGGPQRVMGTAPPPSAGFPAIIILEPTVPRESPRQPAVPYMNQVQQNFIPALLFVRTGQPVEFLNDDEVLHTVRVHDEATHAPAFNVAIPRGEKYVFTFRRDGFYDVGCDIHPEMTAQIVSSTSPYVATADAEGRFAIEGVPPGSYLAVMYKGPLKIERTISVAAGAPPLDLTRP